MSSNRTTSLEVLYHLLRLLRLVPICLVTSWIYIATTNKSFPIYRLLRHKNKASMNQLSIQGNNHLTRTGEELMEKEIKGVGPISIEKHMTFHNHHLCRFFVRSKISCQTQTKPDILCTYREVMWRRRGRQALQVRGREHLHLILQESYVPHCFM